MSSPRLHLTSVTTAAGVLPIRWDLDCPTRGVVILDVNIGLAESNSPLHWRAGDWAKPPLDLCLNETGIVESIQIVFQDESVECQSIIRPSTIEAGQPVFDVSDWPDSRYMDALTVVKTSRLPSDELYAAINGDRPTRSVSITRSLGFDFDDFDQLVGIALGPLSADEWELVEASAP